MAEKTTLVKQESVQNRIFTIRGLHVMLDSHLAELYSTEPKRLNEQVKRNIERFPKEFMFRLKEDEYDFLRSQIATLEDANSLRPQIVVLKDTDSLRSQFATLENQKGRHRKYLPYVFTEQGVAMLSAILRSETAIKVSIQIMQAFIEMRHFIINNAAIFQRLDRVEYRQQEADIKFERIFDAPQKDTAPKQGVFYDGQVFDAYTFVSGIIRSAKTSAILIDNYVDDTVLSLFTKRKKGVAVTIYTKNISKQLALDLEKHNAQYESIIINELKAAHDRFLIIDEKELYHIGASLKDLGKKWFAFSKMDKEALSMLTKLNGRSS